MDRRFLRLYNDELQYFRELSGEFAAEYPKIAGRLGLDKDGKDVCADPFVERLLEGFAFLTTRVQHKFDAEFPRLTQTLLNAVFPHYLAPMPSMLIARLEPNLSDGALMQGFPVPRDTVLRAAAGKGERTACEFRTAHAVTLWPVRLTEARYHTRDIGLLNLPTHLKPRAVLRLRLEFVGDANGEAMAAMPHLDLHLRGNEETPVRLLEQMVTRQAGVIVRPVDPSGRIAPGRNLPPRAIRRLGLEEDEALLPPSPRTFEGYRLIQEYFAFPQRFLFARLLGLGDAFAGEKATVFDILILLDAQEALLEGRVDASNFELFCTPAVNLIRRRADRIQLTDKSHEYQVLTDRTRPLDFEVWSVERVAGIGVKTDEEQPFLPFYRSRQADVSRGAFYVTNRVPRLLTQQEKRFGKNSSYSGSELYVGIVDGAAAPYRPDLKQLALEVLVTNRHLPLSMAVGLSGSDLSPDIGGPIRAVRCLSGPTPPKSSAVEGEILWRLISHLSLNYFSLVDVNEQDGAASFREILKLYADSTDRQALRQIEGIRSIVSKPVIRRVEAAGPVTFARGSELSMLMDEHAFEGTGAFLFGSLLERFFARYVSINSFTETVLLSPQRGEIFRFPIQTGRRPVL